MTHNDSNHHGISELRKRAEEKIKSHKVDLEKSLLPEDAAKAVYDLQVYQIELSIQNEELRSAQEKLEASRTRYFQLYDLAPVGYITLSDKGLITEANLTVANLLGVSRVSLPTKALSQFIFPEDQDIYYRHCIRIFNSDVPQVCEIRLCRKDDDPFWARLESTAGKDVSGFRFCRMVISDISTRKSAEEALKRLRMELDAARSGSWEWNLITGKISWSDEIWRMLGLEPHSCDLSYEVWKNTITPEDREKTGEAFRNAVRNGAEINMEWHTLNSDGKDRWLMTRGRPFSNETGQIARYMGIIIDITERKHLEKEREQLQKQLHQVLKLESIGRLAGGVAHDFNNMLMAIIGNTEMAMEDTDPSTGTYHYLQEILLSANRSADLTRQLLAFARKQPISPKVLNLNDIVTSMIKMIQRLIGENIHLIWNPAMDLWAVKMDPSQIDQILVNLAVNARDAIDGVGTLTIETRNSRIDDAFSLGHEAVLPGDYVQLTVRDTGCGMDKETLENLFEPFFTTKEIGKGTGLGLATLYGIAKQNKGFITVHSEPDQGASFDIFIPRTLAMKQPEKNDVFEKPARGTETILLVEDETAIQRLTKMVLENLGYTVLDANSPEKALSIANHYTGSIHLLITDVVMPHLNGRDLFDRISVIKPGIRVIFMSGYTADIIEDQGGFEQGNYFLYKPFSTKTLAAKVREILDAKEVLV